MRFFLIFWLFAFSNLYSQDFNLSSKTQKAVADTTFVNISNYSTDLVLEMRYATNTNFMNEKVYECSECYLRLKTVKAILKANARFIKLGYKIKFFDCYRPLDIQKKMWQLVPNPAYVANPKTGSIHNRGGAVDITLVDIHGNNLDMGTDFDFFGPESGHDYVKLSKNVIANRKLLKKIMLQSGFIAQNSEWWHYNLKASLGDGVANFKWDCN